MTTTRYRMRPWSRCSSRSLCLFVRSFVGCMICSLVIREKGVRCVICRHLSMGFVDAATADAIRRLRRSKPNPLSCFAELPKARQQVGLMEKIWSPHLPRVRARSLRLLFSLVLVSDTEIPCQGRGITCRANAFVLLILILFFFFLFLFFNNNINNDSFATQEGWWKTVHSSSRSVGRLFVCCLPAGSDSSTLSVAGSVRTMQRIVAKPSAGGQERANSVG